MKLVIESDGTLAGTRVDFSMQADEIPNMIKRQHRRVKRMRPSDFDSLVLHSSDHPTVTATAN